jgi:putative pyrroloquinoline-quinone-binding quinoprotein
VAFGNPHRCSYWVHAVVAAVLLGAPSMPRLSARVSLPDQQALRTPSSGARAGTVAIRFSDLAEVTPANVRGLLPLVARSVAAAPEDARIDPSAPNDLPLQRFVEERTGGMGLPTRGRAGALANRLNRSDSYLLESVSEERTSPSAAAQIAGRELRARDPIGRQVLWSVHEALPISSGTLLTAGGLVFYGTGDGWFKALDARTGQTLWKHWTEGRRLDGPASYRGADGHQYIAVRALPRSPGEGRETVLLFALAH